MNPAETRGVQDLVRLCRVLGRDPLLVQAGGGNVSVKLPPDRLLVKASGLRLAEVSAARGWARADAGLLRRGLAALAGIRSALPRDRAYADLLGRAGRTPGWRVSMEAGFHALIPDRCVAHVHSVAGLLLGALPPAQARRRIRRILGAGVRIASVPAAVPGAELSLALARALGRGARLGAGPRKPLLAVLRGHGLVWGAETAAELLRLSAALETALRAEFGLDRYPPPHLCGSRGCRRAPAPRAEGWGELCFCRWPGCRLDFRPAFPDFVVYFSLWGRGAPDLVRTSERSALLRADDAAGRRAKAEVLFAHALAHTAAGARGMPGLPPAMVRAIAGLESERLRLAQAARRGAPSSAQGPSR
ncbi:MAG: hypothetical protein A2X36_17335 [Elusimicrobia bacterium GWA2_69_24]|nr:MAG: hypothetical protein A2X36_17335 [Elusimicrobia bacterium GWA2_69_24]HBL17922.1 hypothetical protein [Elusimicrobiota bacterium]